MRSFETKRGDRVKCIDNFAEASTLTVGNVYTVVGNGTHAVYIVNDKGRSDVFGSCRFILIKGEHYEIY